MLVGIYVAQSSLSRNKSIYGPMAMSKKDLQKQKKKNAEKKASVAAKGKKK